MVRRVSVRTMIEWGGRPMNSTPRPPRSKMFRYRYVLRPVLHSPAVLYSMLLGAVLGRIPDRRPP